MRKANDITGRDRSQSGVVKNLKEKKSFMMLSFIFTLLLTSSLLLRSVKTLL